MDLRAEADSGGEASKLVRTSMVRKLIHLSMTIIAALGWRVSLWLALAFAGAMLAGSLVVEAARGWWPWLNRLLWRLLPTVFRDSENRRTLGSTWFAVGAVVSLLLFGRDIGGTAVLFLCWGDPAAEFVGRRFGRGGQGKTLAGSLACLLACFLAGAAGVGLGGLSPWAALVGAGVATAVERWSPPPDDNVWMPVLSGLATAVTEGLIGGSVVLLPVWN